MAQSPTHAGAPHGKISSTPQKETDDLQVKSPDQEAIPGSNVKKARGLGKNAGHSPHEAGTDQRVEDAKKQRPLTTALPCDERSPALARTQP